MASLKEFYSLTKPGIIRGNALSATAGFLLAARGHVNLVLMAATIGGLSLVIASAGVLNNYIDRSLDRKMTRTKKRALAQGSISGRSALIYAGWLGIAGEVILAAFANGLTAGLALFGLVMYVVVYGFWKRRSTLGTIIGSLSGAVPPVVGYCAVTNRLDGAAGLLFLILVFWQMPHFFAIALYRVKDYASAGLPVLPVAKGVQTTKRQIVAYTIAFTVVSALPSVFGYTGRVYLAVALLLGLSWTILSLRGFSAPDDSRWARQMFSFSLLAMTVLCLVMSVDHFLP
ncbi:MAG: heme o synthase [Candidatus Saccharibacteria bacterium]